MKKIDGKRKISWENALIDKTDKRNMVYSYNRIILSQKSTPFP